MGFNPEFFSLDDYRAKHVETIAKEKAGYKSVTRPVARLMEFLTLDTAHDLAAGRPQLDEQRHLPEGMGRAGKTGVIAADSRLNPVEDALGNLPVFNIIFSNFINRAVYGGVIIACGDDQVDPGYFTGFVNPVVVYERAPGGFNHAHTLLVVLV